MSGVIRAAVVGGAGYTGGELIRLLLHHPSVQIAWVHSTSQAGKPVHSTHQDLVGETDLTFTDQLQWSGVEVVFFCMGHGASAKFLAEHQVPSTVKIVDLSQDFRLAGDHDFVYGLPEVNRERIAPAQHIANPGCFATALQLALVPAMAAGAVVGDVHVQAITGSTGAGQSLSPTGHFSWRHANVSVYKAFAHQHLHEIGETMTHLNAGWEGDIHFVPIRGNFTRGIMASLYFESAWSETAARAAYAKAYHDHPFTHVVDDNPHLKQVVNTNKALVHVAKHGKMVHVVSMIDNLLKGASGQAVQNMNLLFDQPETTGLTLKASAF